MNPSKRKSMLTALYVVLAATGMLRILAGQEAAAEKNKGNDDSRTAAVILLHGIIDPPLEQFIYRKLARAKARGVDYVIIEIDSLGGYAGASFNLADHLRSIDWATTVAYIPEEALSGASVAALGCKQIVLQSDARFGDAGPIEARSGAFRYVPEKIQSNMAQHLRVLARAHGRPEALAEALVDQKLKVYEYQEIETGKRHYFSSRELKNIDETKWKRVGEVPESGDSRFLEVVGARAVELGLADQLVSSRDDLLARLQVEEPPAVYRPGMLESAVRFLNHPFITAILFIGGLVALYFEFSAPGIGVGGTIAALCFGLFFWSRFFGGTAVWSEVFLFAAGILFLLIELFIIPGFGIAGFAGLGLIVVSLVLASQEFVVPQTPKDRERLAVSLTVLVASGFVFLGCAVVITRHFGRLPVLSRLVLSPPPPEPEVRSETKVSNADVFQLAVNIGDIGVADSALRPAGKAVFGEAYVDVVADGSYVDRGKMVRVVQINGNRVVVREVEGKPPVA